MQSGTAPYEYAIRGGRFRAADPYLGNTPIGLSGILLEQAQFVITAERRKWNKFAGGGSHFLPNFNLYVNPAISPSGRYEPKVDGSTLGNEIYPAAAWILDHIQETRIALNNMFSDYSDDSDLDQFQYRAAWFQSLYPESPSGFYFADDADIFSSVVGHWEHRFPSETGIIDYLSNDVLGSSGVIYDIDFAEVMFNPAPHMSTTGFDTIHGRRVNNSEDTFNIQQFPLFPGFQKTDGSLVPLTEREPTFLRTHRNYNIDHITSGAIRLDGYVVTSGTSFFLGRNANNFDTNIEEFIPLAQGLREVDFGGNFPDARVFIIPKPQASGVYRAAVVNKRSDFPNTTIESGVMSFWPQLTHYWPSGVGVDATLVGSTTTLANLGYHVFDDALWMLDTSPTNASALTIPSGLAMLSPYTGHRMWVRYADQTAIDSTVSFSGPPTVTNLNWSTFVGLERPAADVIYRVHPTIQRPFASTSGQFRLGLYNDNLDLVTDVTTTSDSVETNLVDQFPLGGGDVLGDLWLDINNNEYWVATASAAGFAFWKFDSNLKYINKYIQLNGIVDPKGFSTGGLQFVFGDIGSSGIYPTTIVDGTEPFDNTANTPQVGTVTLGTPKNINAAPFIGVSSFATIHDIFEITGGTHVPDGIYAIVSWFNTSGTINSIYLVRIEEDTSTWEIHAITRMETSIQVGTGRRELLYMPY